MSQYHKDLLSEVINEWSDQQLDDYIWKLEEREVELHTWLKELRKLRQLRKRALKTTPENGPRDGR